MLLRRLATNNFYTRTVIIVTIATIQTTATTATATTAAFAAVDAVATIAATTNTAISSKNVLLPLSSTLVYDDIVTASQ